MKDRITVELFNVPFTKNDNNRFSSSQLDTYVSGTGNNRIRMYDCRMTKSNQIKMNTQNLSYDRITEFGYGRWYIQNDDASRSPKNTVLGKPFYHYFFIDSFAYVNPNVTIISFSDDVFSTFWRDDMSLCGYCKRRHVLPSEDKSYYFDLPEPTSTTDYIFDGSSLAKFDVFQGGEQEYIYLVSGILAQICVQTDDTVLSNLLNKNIPNVYDPIKTGSYYSGIPSAGVTYVFNNIDDIVNLVSQCNALGYTNAIGEIYMCPKALHTTEVKHFKNSSLKFSITWDAIGASVKQSFDQEILSNTYTFTLIDELTLPRLTSYHGYTPKYNKCFSEQYYKVVLTNGSEYREYNPSLLNGYSTGEFKFRVFADNAPSTDLFCNPIAYNGQNLTPFSEGLHLQYSKPVSVCNDLTKAGQVKLAETIGSSILNTLVETGEAAMFTKIAGKDKVIQNEGEDSTEHVSSSQSGIRGRFSDIQHSTFSDNDEMSNAGFKSELTSQIFDVVKSVGQGVKSGIEISGSIGRSNSKYGSTGSNVSNYACCLPKGNTSDTFCLYNKLVSVEDIKRVDTFFSRYGYSVEETKNNIPLRDNYTYLEGDINITNYHNLPVYARNDIQAMFTHGITIWNTDMYSYDVTN